MEMVITFGYGVLDLQRSHFAQKKETKRAVGQLSLSSTYGLKNRQK